MEAYLPASKARATAVPPERFAETIASLIRAGADAPVSFGWFAGEFASAQAVRDVFKRQFGLAKKKQMSVAYWRAGAPGHSSRAL
ncbi:MAG: SIP domain-containing protein [Pseudomonadota bacterium]